MNEVRIQSLNGMWLYRIGKGKQREISVPFSTLAVGHSECECTFTLTETAPCTYLKFDGITYAAKVFLNDIFIGDMLPYSEYLFDVTDFVCDVNALRVELEDIAPAFGPSEGWENFGGIIRDVSVLYAAENRITDVFFHATLQDDYRNAVFTVETTAQIPQGVFHITLFDGDKAVCSYEQAADATAQAKLLCDVRLWDVDTPHLYTLCVALEENGETVDTYSCKVGFREFICDNHRFYLNGKPLFLKGVCKHEMFADSGHCPTEEQMRRDMLMIKDTGCNFVRLVHYPHHKKVMEIADEIGLMVSEEPGLWWSDTANAQVSAGSLEVLRRTILRDRNHPSVVFWLSFNECRFTEEYLVASAKVCRENDPTRLVSGANCMNNEDTLKYYTLCNFDFYTMHPYAPTTERAKESAAVLNDKPLLFTEWGGYYVYDNPKLLGEFLHQFYALYENNALAGALFWEWSELNDFNRTDGACVDGVLREGLVDADRHPTLIFESFCRALKGMGTKEEPPFWFAPLTYTAGNNLLTADGEKCCLQKALDATRELEENGKKLMRRRVLKEGPVLKNVDGLLDVPLVLHDNTEYTISCSVCTDVLTVYGMVSAHKGYPLDGNYGEAVAELTVIYTDGSSQTTVLKNGIDVTTVFELRGSSRINPVAENSARVATFGYDKNFEQYLINERKIPLDIYRTVKAVTLCSCNNGYALLIYGMR